MAPTTSSIGSGKAVASQQALLEHMISLIVANLGAQLKPYTTRLVGELLDFTCERVEAVSLHQRLQIGNLLKDNSYAFIHIAAERLERAVREEVAKLAPAAGKQARRIVEGALSLVPMEEMDSRVAFAAVSRPFEAIHSDRLATLNVRLSFVLERNILNVEQNPFRPGVFLGAMNEAWREFLHDETDETKNMIVARLRPNMFFELGALYEELDLALMSKGVLPGSVDSYRIRKTDGAAKTKAARAENHAALAKQLRQFFAEEPAPEFDASIPLIPDLPNLPASGGGWRPSGAEAFRSTVTNQVLHKRDPNAARAPLLAFLHSLQQDPAAAGAIGAMPGMPGMAGMGAMGADAGMHTGQHLAGAGEAQGEGAPNVFYLPRLKQSIPAGSMSRGDEHTIDLLSKIFETVFIDPSIPPEIRELIQFLQIPVLKAALLDKNFFFQEAHPARRMIDLLSRMGWEQRKSADDPVFQAMQQSVNRVGRDFDQELAVFSEAVKDLEASIEKEESKAAQAIAEPIAKALRQEKMTGATRSARTAVATRVCTDHVVPVVETFLEQKWTEVLTIAYSVEDEKPGAVDIATRTMDDLIWSVQPKITRAERKELITKLPGMLLTLNKWLDIINWKDEDRLRFFADLAECHAAIVRAPIDMAPERQLELAAEAAKRDNERRIAQERAVAAAQVEEELDESVASLERGMWLEFTEDDASVRQVKLAWVSPLRTLYIFATDKRTEAFSMPAEKLAEAFNNGLARVIRTDGVVERALMSAMGAGATNDPEMDDFPDVQLAAG